MADLIDRQTLIKEMEKQLGVLVDTYYERYGSSGLAHTSGFAEAIDYAYLAPAADAVEVVHGWWIFGHTIGRAWMKCSECLKSQMPNGCFTYCPNCGAKMDGERREEDAAD